MVPATTRRQGSVSCAPLAPGAPAATSPVPGQPTAPPAQRVLRQLLVATRHRPTTARVRAAVALGGGCGTASSFPEQLPHTIDLWRWMGSRRVYLHLQARADVSLAYMHPFYVLVIPYTRSVRCRLRWPALRHVRHRVLLLRRQRHGPHTTGRPRPARAYPPQIMLHLCAA